MVSTREPSRPKRVRRTAHGTKGRRGGVQEWRSGVVHGGARALFVYVQCACAYVCGCGCMGMEAAAAAGRRSGRVGALEEARGLLALVKVEELGGLALDVVQRETEELEDLLGGP